MMVVLHTLWPYLRRHRRLLLIASFAMIGEVVTALAMPWPLKFIIDSVLFRQTGKKRKLRSHLSHHRIIILLWISGIALGIALLDAAFTYIDNRISAQVAQRSIYDLRKNLFAHLQRLSISFHQHVETRVGDLLSRLSGDVQALQDLAAQGASNLVTNGLTLLLMVGVMYFVNPLLASIALVITVPMFFVARRTARQMKLAVRVARKQEGRVSAVLQESLSSVKLVQAYGREHHEEGRLADESAKSLEASLEAAELQSRLSPVITIFSTLASVAVTTYGVFLTIDRRITPGDLLLLLAYLRGMQTPVRQLAKLSYGIVKAAAAAERVNETLAIAPAVAERPDAREIERVAGRVRFEGITFGYLTDRPVLRDVTLEAAPGDVIAVVGPTGAGKSTLLSLLPRFFDPWEGRVLIDGIDVRDLKLSSLRSQIALVLQESLIFRTTIRENIAYGRPDASDAEIEAAAEAAGVNTIAGRFEAGYDTIVSERGASLSGGEKQCIGVARALLKDAPILILDEPTSSLDSLTERLVLQGLRRLMEGRTVFIIAHRLTTVLHSGRVAVIQEGRLVEMGAPTELLESESLFAELARTQRLET